MSCFLCAIGGGEIGRPGKKIEVYNLDKQILNLIGKNNPKILFIPTASNDSDSYCEVFKNYFEKKHNCKVEFLFLIKEKLNFGMIRAKILASDIIYIGGGDTELLIKKFEEYKLKKLIQEAIDKQISIIGFSAGGIILFEKGISEKQGNLRIIEGFSFIKGVFCPHSNKKKIEEIENIFNDGKIVMSDDATAFVVDSEGKIYLLSETIQKRIKIMIKKGQKLLEINNYF